MTTYTHINSNKRKSLLLIAVFFVLIAAIGYTLDYSQGIGGAFFVVLALIYASISAVIGYYTGDKIALWTSGAHPVSKEENQYVVRMVENLAITAGLPMPKVYVIPDDDINAFACGRDPKHASIAVTQGAITKLENEELEGVVAHELSHIGNYDIRYMTLVIVLVGTIMVLSDMFWRVRFIGGGGRGRNSGGGAIMLIGLALLILSPIFAQLIRLAVSRKREYLADASGALLTRYPEGLARALEKIGTQGARIERATHSTAHLYFANPLSSGFGNFFSTHPPVQKRIEALRNMGH
ncbi:MAG: zinc metalloprotease HtpX [Candidatus Kerfeldbacteria bacterium RIFCSPLOWO2_01_FULL_48_11]|uniref:Protease HtpX homolog n=1 Tax=Candidatus Kerfeldbacteria bacterium RIFCSPLOWO2_01_FULL_48_11 TaxID=1798543 RepID=A0A1G2B8A6_9BACT|nr:MAG: Protease HtpX-like protein [Parcubacteria group bacterium GW2011_GWA2_48_9]KKW14578.1 MAG: Protease HtpX-like protein [Parcubacteria group bacterium GW2011_GWC2_49_9]OGY84839.1 MAG: zinc metalloprotease HtpX [Candidatus Kerfeldbacteria bacterium RIFCSPLOWO2_01_FULL_48_11]HCM67792.1 zinc metalloprotease HtpX [Candidatus Kerfeldbacteria bacterium]